MSTFAVPTNQTMMYLLSITTVVLLGVVIFQLALFKKTQRRHEQKMDVLRQVIVEMARSSSQREEQVRISDELLQQLRSANNVISEDISGLVTEFVSTLQANNLLR